MKIEGTIKSPVRKRAGREDRILDAAQEFIAEKGYAAMNMDELAARAEITKPTLYRYFPSKEDIAIQAVTRLLRNGREHLRSGKRKALLATPSTRSTPTHRPKFG